MVVEKVLNNTTCSCLELLEGLVAALLKGVPEVLLDPQAVGFGNSKTEGLPFLLKVKEVLGDNTGAVAWVSEPMRDRNVKGELAVIFKALSQCPIFLFCARVAVQRSFTTGLVLECIV